MKGKLVKCYFEDGTYCVKFDFGDDYVYSVSDGTNGHCKTNYEDVKPIEERCTLTDAVEKYKEVTVGDVDEVGLCFNLDNKEDVKDFVENHLYKQKTLEDGIYEGFVNNETSLTVVYVKNNAFGSWKDRIHYDIKLLKNPKKIAEL